MLRKDRLGIRRLQEEQRVVAISQFVQSEDGSRLGGKAAGFPHLELLEVAQDHPAGRGDACRGIRGLLPVALSLILRLRQRYAGGLHLDDQGSGPVQVHEPRGRPEVFEQGADLLPVRAVAGEELVEEGLRLGALRPGVVAPTSHEGAKGLLNLGTAEHRQISRSESPA